MLRADLHIHTNHSGDSNTAIDTLIAHCLESGINCLAVTDHNTIVGALETQRLAPFPVIVSEEVKTRSGEIIGFFLKEAIPGGLSAPETVTRIKSQGGLVGIPHAFDRFRPTTLTHKAMEAVLPFTDIIEVYNSYTIFPGADAKARRFAKKHNLLSSAGSDAHSLNGIGKTFVEMAEFNGPEEFCLSLKQGGIVGHRASPLDFLIPRLVKITKLLQKLRS